MGKEYNIFEEYDKAYESGNRRLKVAFFGKPQKGEKSRKLTNAEIGALCRHACEKYMHWSWKDVEEGKFTADVQRDLMLDRPILDIEYPGFVSVAEQGHYLIQLMYPEMFYCGTGKDWRYVDDVYADVVEGRRKALPHGLFNGGIRNADKNSYSAGYANLCHCFLFALDACYKTETEEGEWDMTYEEFCELLEGGRIRDSFYNKVRLRQTLKYMTEELPLSEYKLDDSEHRSPMSELKRRLRDDALQMLKETWPKAEREADKEFSFREDDAYRYYKAYKDGLLSIATAREHCADTDLFDAMTGYDDTPVYMVYVDDLKTGESHVEFWDKDGNVVDCPDYINALI